MVFADYSQQSPDNCPHQPICIFRSLCCVNKLSRLGQIAISERFSSVGEVRGSLCWRPKQKGGINLAAWAPVTKLGGNVGVIVEEIPSRFTLFNLIL